MSLIVAEELAVGVLPDAVWVGAINGILRSSLAEERVVGLIGQAFDQSPYLSIKTN